MMETFLDEISDIGCKIKSNEPPAITDKEKQAAVAITSMEKTIIALSYRAYVRIPTLFQGTP